MSTIYFIGACTFMIVGAITDKTGSCIISAGLFIASEIAELKK